MSKAMCMRLLQSNRAPFFWSKLNRLPLYFASAHIYSERFGRKGKKNVLLYVLISTFPQYLFPSPLGVTFMQVLCMQ
jgi:hypothetical protein